MHALRGVRERYPDQVAIVFRNWPLPYHQHAYAAARAAECAGRQGRFAELHDNLYLWQDSLGAISYDTLAQRSGVPDLKAFATCAGDSSVVPAIEADILAAQEIGGHGTPTVAINGQLLRAVPDSLGLDRLVSEQIAQVAHER